MTPATTTTTSRYFIRCTDCLTIAAIDVNPGEFSIAELRCAACNGQIESMGRVHLDRLVHVEHRCACDSRCQSARGPHCDCSCGGKNHGSTVLVTIVHDAGGIPRVQMMKPEKARQIAREYHDAIEAVLAVTDALRARRRAGEFLPRADFDRLLNASRTLGKARKARSHASRMKALRAIVPAPSLESSQDFTAQAGAVQS